MLKVFNKELSLHTYRQIICKGVLTGMKVLISFTKLTKIILLNKLKYYRLLSVLFNNIYINANINLRQYNIDR